MFGVEKEALKKFFVGSNRYIVPFFQRSYVWKKENWQELWDDITAMYNDDKQEEHFLGTVIVRQRDVTEIKNTGDFDLVDGQQRFTTFSILLKALAEACTSENETRLKKNIEEYLYFTDDRGKNQFRIEHSKNDKKHYERLLESSDEEITLKSTDKEAHKLVKCYVFFRENIEGLKADTRAEKIKLKNVILDKVPFVSMLLGEADDAQEIFDTVNSLGVRLTIAELIKNYIFRDRKLYSKYKAHWKPVFEYNEETINFWTAYKTSGRISRTNIELLLYCFLTIQTGRSIKLKALLREYKSWWDRLSLDKKTEMLEELQDYAKVFRSFPFRKRGSIKPTEYDKRLFRILDTLSVTAPYPLILYYCKNHAADNERGKRNDFFRTLGSYLMRCYVCQLQLKDYNFLDLIKKELQNRETTLADALLKHDKDHDKFPTDEKFKEAFINNHFANNLAREILYSIALSQITKNSDLDGLPGYYRHYSLEHIMPRKWEEHWKDPNMSDEQEIERDRTLKTIGNLTLVRPSLNSEMKNRAWRKKRKVLEEKSQLKITTEYLNKEKWDEKEIKKRAKDLYAIAKETWRL